MFNFVCLADFACNFDFFFEKFFNLILDIKCAGCEISKIYIFDIVLKLFLIAFIYKMSKRNMREVALVSSFWVYKVIC